MSGGPGPKMAAIGEAVRLVPVDVITTFQFSAVGFSSDDITANIISKHSVYYLISLILTNKIQKV